MKVWNVKNLFPLTMNTNFHFPLVSVWVCVWPLNINIELDKTAACSAGLLTRFTALSLSSFKTNNTDGSSGAHKGLFPLYSKFQTGGGGAGGGGGGLRAAPRSSCGLTLLSQHSNITRQLLFRGATQPRFKCVGDFYCIDTSLWLFLENKNKIVYNTDRAIL